MDTLELSLTINGRTDTPRGLAPTVTLLEYLRVTGRVGTKEGCGDGDCGACTVALVGEDADGKPCYQAVNSCLLPLGVLAGREVVTVEGLADGTLHPVQRSLAEGGGSQCGYCTPGFVMSLFAAYYGGDREDRVIEGNLCRCTGYLPIRRALRGLEEATPDRFMEALAHVPRLQAVSIQSGGQALYRPTRLGDALELLQRHPGATVVAGGTDVGLEFSHHRLTPEVVIALEGVAELRTLEDTETHTDIGAGVPLAQLERQLHGVFPPLDEMLRWFAARQIKNRATLGGNLGTASPIGDLPPVLMALDATVTLASLRGERTVPIAAFFMGYRQTVRVPDELIVSVRIPKGLAQGAVRRFARSYKVGKRGADDISIVAAAFAVDLDAAGRVVSARLAYGGVAPTPVRLVEVEADLTGQPWDALNVGRMKARLEDAVRPISDLRGSAAYRRALVGNLFEKFHVETEPVKGVTL